MKYRLNIGFLFAIIFLSSCSSVLYTNLDVLRPAQFSFSPNANRLLIVDNSVTQPDEYGHIVQFFDAKAQSVAVSTDSLAFFTLEALAENLVSKDFFRMITLHNTNICNQNDFFKIKTLPFDTVNALCDRYDSDVILALDRIRVIDKADEVYSYDDNKFHMTLEARFETRWSVYYPEKTNYESVVFKDTLYWTASSNTPKVSYYDLPNLSDALIDGALYSGTQVAEKFIPKWDKKSRYLINYSNKHLKEGLDSMTVKNFEGAISVWENVLDKSKSNKLKAIAAHNIALNYEILSNVEKALEYSDIAMDCAQKSISLKTELFDIIEVYNESLGRRKDEVELLDKQLGN